VLLGLSALYLGYKAYSTWENMNEWKHSAELYKAQSKNIKFFTCTTDDNTNRICVQIDKKYKDQEWGDNLKILTINADKKNQIPKTHQ